MGTKPIDHGRLLFADEHVPVSVERVLTSARAEVVSFSLIRLRCLRLIHVHFTYWIFFHWDHYLSSRGSVIKNCMRDIANPGARGPAKTRHGLAARRYLREDILPA